MAARSCLTVAWRPRYRFARCKSRPSYLQSRAARSIPEVRSVRPLTLGYIISVPPVAQSTGARPILCFLHGYGEAAPLQISEAVTRRGPLRTANPRRVTERFIIVAPQLPAAGDNWYEKADSVRQLMTEIQREYTGDPDRTYLTGFSFGGNGVFDLAATQADLWAAF
jgi:poly(3-hydroxybutyrate) depolymerase